MTETKILTLVIAAVFMGYLIYIFVRYGILPSFSASYYALKDDGNKWLFIVFMACIGIGLLLVASFNPHPMVWTFWLAGSGAAFVGIAASYNDRMTEWVHIAGTYAVIIFSSLGVGMVFGNWWAVYCLVGSSALLWLFRSKINNYGYWAEFLVLVWVLVGLFVA